MKRCLTIALLLSLLAGLPALAETSSDANLLPAPDEVAALTGEAEPEAGVTVWFEEGFGLSIPEGWVSYPVQAADQAEGVRYALGDGSGERFLFIQLKPTALRNADALSSAIEGEDGLTKTGELSFGGNRFVAFIDLAQNASCCATIWGDRLAVFMFTPQSDADFMLTATQLMQTFAIP